MKKYRKYILFGSASLFILISIALIFSFNTEVEAEDNTDLVKENIVDDVSEKFFIDIKGEVKKPGVYEVTKGMIVNDAIKLAGGITKKGNTNNINLSKELTKEMVIYVFSNSQLKKETIKNEIACNCEVIEVNNCVNDEIVNNNEVTPNKVNINTASKEELMTLSGIGEAKALAIIEYRINNRFNSIDDIKNISGIGEAMFDKIKDNITV